MPLLASVTNAVGMAQKIYGKKRPPCKKKRYLFFTPHMYTIVQFPDQ
jgi:hypothetical protein